VSHILTGLQNIIFGILLGQSTCAAGCAPECVRPGADVGHVGGVNLATASAIS